MTRTSRDDRALRREALATRASLQRIQLATAVGRARQSSSSKGAGALALRLARSALAARAAAPRSARPLLLSAGWMAVRALRASPTARWVAGAVAVGGAVWWIARSLRAGTAEREVDAPDDRNPDPDVSG